MPVKWVRSELRREVCTFNSQLSRVNHPYCPAAVLAPLNPSSWGRRAVISPKSISVSFQKNMAPYVGNTEGNTLFHRFTTPAEDADMLRGVCMNGFYFVSLGLDVSSGFSGWGQAVLFICSFFSADKWRVHHWWCHWDHPMIHGVLCVCESCFDRLVSNWCYCRSGVRKRHRLVGRGRNIVIWFCDKVKWMAWHSEHVLGPKENRSHSTKEVKCRPLSRAKNSLQLRRMRKEKVHIWVKAIMTWYQVTSVLNLKCFDLVKWGGVTPNHGGEAEEYETAKSIDELKCNTLFWTLKCNQLYGGFLLISVTPVFARDQDTVSSTLLYGTESSLGKEVNRCTWDSVLLTFIIFFKEWALTSEGGASGLQSLRKNEDREILQILIKRLGFSPVRKKRCFNCIVKCANWIPPLKDRSNKADVVGVYCAVGIIGQNKCVFIFRNISFE